jgi:hypothetical protein
MTLKPMTVAKAFETYTTIPPISAACEYRKLSA